MTHLTPTLLVLCTLLVGVPGAAWAEKADRNKPMNIEADTLRHDEARQISIFTGKVLVTKGSMTLRGHQLEVRQDAQGNQFGTMTAEAGQRAFFRQKRDTLPGQPPEFMEGEAQTIEYDGRADQVKLQRQAELRRYRETQLSDELTGAHIVYNNRDNTFTVQGGASSSATTGAGDNRNRVRAILTPRPDTTAPAAATPPAPNAEGAQATSVPPSPALRPSEQLDGQASPQ